MKGIGWKGYFHPNSDSLWCIAQTSYLISETLPDTNVNGRGDSHECNNINFTWILWSLHIQQLWFKSFKRSQLRRTAWITNGVQIQKFPDKIKSPLSSGDPKKRLAIHPCTFAGRLRIGRSLWAKMQAGTTALLLIIFIYRNTFAYLPMIALHTLLSPYFAMSGIGYDSFMSSSKMIRVLSLFFFWISRYVIAHAFLLNFACDVISSLCAWRLHTTWWHSGKQRLKTDNGEAGSHLRMLWVSAFVSKERTSKSLLSFRQQKYGFQVVDMVCATTPSHCTIKWTQLHSDNLAGWVLGLTTNIKNEGGFLLQEFWMSTLH